MENTTYDFPTEEIELPSKGLIYPEDNTLSSGKVTMKYMTAKEEDILTNQSYIQNGTVLDKLFQKLIVSKINYNDLIVGDKNAIMVAARILGYGKDYTFDYNGTEYSIDLTTIDNKPFEVKNKGVNEFDYTLPSTGVNITYKILNNSDENKIKAEVDSLKKINKNDSSELSTRLKYTITSVNGDREVKTIREFVDKHLLARDSREFRKHIKETQPDVDLTFFPEGNSSRIDIPVGVKFFWPDF
jgi:hypothetical protein